MHHQTLKKLVADNLELILKDEFAAEQKLTAEGLTAEEVAEVIAKAKETPAEKAPKEIKGEDKGFIKCSVRPTYNDEGVLNEEPKVIETFEPVFISQEQADILNEQWVNTKIYYKKG